MSDSPRLDSVETPTTPTVAGLRELFLVDRKIPPNELHVRLDGVTVARIQNIGLDQDIRIAVGSPVAPPLPSETPEPTPDTAPERAPAIAAEMLDWRNVLRNKATEGTPDAATLQTPAEAAKVIAVPCPACATPYQCMGGCRLGNAHAAPESTPDIERLRTFLEAAAERRSADAVAYGNLRGVNTPRDTTEQLARFNAETTALRWLADALPSLIAAKQEASDLQDDFRRILIDKNAKIVALESDRSQLRTAIEALPVYHAFLDPNPQQQLSDALLRSAVLSLMEPQ